MSEFRMASRTPEEIATAQQDIKSAFSVVKNPDGSVNRKGVQELKKNEMELGELIVQLVNDQMLMTDPTPFMVDVVDGTFGDDYLYQEVTSSLRVVDRAYGTKPQSQRLSFTEFSISTTPKELVVEVPLEQIATGRYDPALITSVMAETKIRYTVGAILDALDAGVPSAADRSGQAGYNLRYAGLTAANLDKALDGLMDQGYSPTVFGRHLALVGIRGFAGWATTGSDAALREFETRGMVGTYHGAPIVSIQERFSRRYLGQVIRYDRVYVASNAQPKGALFMRKDLSFLDFAEVLPAEGVFRVGMRWEDGLLVWDPYQYRIITI